MDTGSHDWTNLVSCGYPDGPVCGGWETRTRPRLIGSTDGTREQIINPHPFIEQANVDLDISAIMAKIGSSAFEVAYDSGRGMTLDEAIALTLNI